MVGDSTIQFHSMHKTINVQCSVDYNYYIFYIYYISLHSAPPSPSHDTVSAVPVGRRGVIRVSWTAPTVPRGELPITGYIIQYKVQNSNVLKYWAVMSNSETEVTGLKPGTVYRVYVAGVSAIAIGLGSYCCERTPVLVRTYNGKWHFE